MSKNRYGYRDIKKLYEQNKHKEVSKIVKNREITDYIRNRHLLKLSTEYNHTSLAQALLKLPMVIKNSNLEAIVENALHNGNKELVDSFIENTTVNLNDHYYKNFDPPYYLINAATSKGHFDLAQHLIDKGHAQYEQLDFLSIEKIVDDKKWEFLDNFIDYANDRGKWDSNGFKLYLLEGISKAENNNRNIALDRAIDKMLINVDMISRMLSGNYPEVSSKLLNTYKDNLDNEQLEDFVDLIVLEVHNAQKINMFEDFITYAFETDTMFHEFRQGELIIDFIQQDNVEMASFIYNKSNFKPEIEERLYTREPFVFDVLQNYQKTEKIKEKVMNF